MWTVGLVPSDNEFSKKINAASIQFIQQRNLGLVFREAFLLLKRVLIGFFLAAFLLIMFDDFVHHRLFKFGFNQQYEKLEKLLLKHFKAIESSQCAAICIIN
jgi:hypothetical protein